MGFAPLAAIQGSDLLKAALAQSAGGQNPLTTFGFLAVMVVIFYFFLIRPQQKQMKEHKAMLSSLKKGDVVVVGGIIGRIHSVAEKFIVVELAPGARVRVLASSVTGKAPEGLMSDEEPKSEGKS
ncbi:MAG TPA: preprotein translocase subunit YajC [Myxococcales bacterium]